MTTNGDKRRRLNERLDRAIDEAKAALSPIFDNGAHDLPEDERSALDEVSFKLGMLRIVVIDRDLIADQAEARWQEEKARRAAALLRFEQRSAKLPE